MARASKEPGRAKGVMRGLPLSPIPRVLNNSLIQFPIS